MAAKEQLTAMEMIWGFMSGTTGHMGKTDFAPQKDCLLYTSPSPRDS